MSFESLAHKDVGNKTDDSYSVHELTRFAHNSLAPGGRPLDMLRANGDGVKRGYVGYSVRGPRVAGCSDVEAYVVFT